MFFVYFKIYILYIIYILLFIIYVYFIYLCVPARTPQHEDPVMETGASARLGNFIREVEDNQRFEACVQAGDVSRASSTPSFVFLEEVMEQAEGHGGRVQWVMKGLDGTRDEDRQSESARDTSK